MIEEITNLDLLLIFRSCLWNIVSKMTYMNLLIIYFWLILHFISSKMTYISLLLIFLGLSWHILIQKSLTSNFYFSLFFSWHKNPKSDYPLIQSPDTFINYKMPWKTIYIKIKLIKFRVFDCQNLSISNLNMKVFHIF